MRSRKKCNGIRWLRVDLLSAVMAGSLSGSHAADFKLSRSTIDGGGVIHSNGGTFELSGTIGQPDAGVLVGGGFTLTGGFWFSTPPGDCNQDGAPGLSDVISFVDCLGGPGGDPATGPCRCFDVDGSGGVDLADFAVLQSDFAEE